MWRVSWVRPPQALNVITPNVSVYLADGQEIPQFGLYKNKDLPAAVQEMVFRGNARRLLGPG